MSTNFALVGAAGYIAPRHLKAIHEVGGQLVAAMDPHDSVGMMDQYFPDCRFFTEFERFDRYLERLRRERPEERVRFLSVCSPNYLHDAHCRLGLRVHADVICEKPLTITPWNMDALSDLEREYGQRVYTVLQLRLLPDLIALRQRLVDDPERKRAQVNLTYVTRRGSWYHTSWKGDREKSGGVGMNIGIHFFDLLLWLFGNCRRHELHMCTDSRMAGFLELDWADVTWLLSLEAEDLPPGYLAAKKPAFRSLTMDGTELEFSPGFTDLHTAVYRDILNGGGFGILDAKPSVELVHTLRASPIVAHPAHRHPGLGSAVQPQVSPQTLPPSKR